MILTQQRAGPVLWAPHAPGGGFSGRSAALLKHSRLTCDGDTLTLKVAAPYRALVSESVERRLEQAADELDMDYALSS
ncbi:MAG: hypothetical protein R3C46_00890 [Hyphomonadaceae bacterium]